MDFSFGYPSDEGLLLVDRRGSLRLYDGEDTRLLYRSKDQQRVRMPCIRRPITRYRSKLFYSDGVDSFILEPPELLPSERPAGYILDGPLTCKDKVAYRGNESKRFKERITACLATPEGPVLGLYRNSRARVLLDRRYFIGRDLVSVIKAYGGIRVGTLKGKLVEISSGFVLDLGREVRDIEFVDGVMIVLTRTDGRSLIFVIEDGEIKEKHVLHGRYNSLVMFEETLYAIGEKVSKLIL